MMTNFTHDDEFHASQGTLHKVTVYGTAMGIALTAIGIKVFTEGGHLEGLTECALGLGALATSARRIYQLTRA